MSEYTPTTYEVMNRYYSERSRILFPGDEGLWIDEEFDRWLTQHDLEVAQAERNRTIETLNKHHENLMDSADRASRNADDDPAWYIERAQTVTECIELVKKQVN